MLPWDWWRQRNSSAELGRCDAGLVLRIREAVGRLGLPLTHEFDLEEVLGAMGTDKKRRGRALRFVLPLRIGEVTLVEDVPAEAVARALASISLPDNRPSGSGEDQRVSTR